MKENLKLSLLALLGIFLAFFCLIWGFSFRPKLKEKKEIPPKLERQEILPEVILGFSPQRLTQYQGESFIVNLLIESEEEIVAADLYLSYDNQILEIEKITPGKFFSEPKELSQEIDKTEGRIFYALGSFSPQGGRGILISLTFKGKTAGEKAQVLLEKNTQVVTSEVEKIKPALPKAGVYTILEARK